MELAKRFEIVHKFTNNLKITFFWVVMAVCRSLLGWQTMNEPMSNELS